MNTQQTWNGFPLERFDFEGREAWIVFPHTKEPGGNWAIKTEYWDAFPGMEIALLEAGFHLTYMKNLNRWATPEDCHARARFVHHIAATYGLRDRCVPVGMSCGGAHAVSFAGLHPECVAALVIDAPVLNFCSCPAYLGRQDMLGNAWEREFIKAYPGMTKAKLLSFPHHPINHAPVLVAHKIPLLMLWGTEDMTVPYAENGALLEEAYRASDAPITVIPRVCQGHHPHGVADATPLLDFMCRFVQ